MEKKMSLCLRASMLAALAWIAAGCETTPYDRATVFYDRAKFPEKVSADLGLGAETIVQHGRCQAHVTTPGSNRGPENFCVYALTPGAVYVATWDASLLVYRSQLIVRFDQHEGIGYAVLFRTNQVQFFESMRVVGLTATIDDGGYVNQDANEKMYKYISGRGVKIRETTGLISSPPRGGPVVIPVIVPR